MAGPMDSVGRAAKANMLLIVECGHCYHVGRFRANDVAKVVGWNKPLEAVRFKCKRCSRKDTTVRTQFIDQDHPPKGYIWTLQKIQNLDGELQIGRSTCCKSLFSSDGARQAHMFKAGGGNAEFLSVVRRSCRCNPPFGMRNGDGGPIQHEERCLTGSVAYKQKELVKCMAMMRAEPDVYRKNWATLLNTSVRAMPELYCNRFVKALASGRLTYAMYKDAHTPTADRTEFIKIIQGH